MNGTPVSLGKFLTLFLPVVVALLTTACFNIILAEPPARLEEPTALLAEPLALSDAIMVIPVSGDPNLPSEPQASHQEAIYVDGSELDPALDTFVPTVVHGPTFTSTAEQLPAYRLTVNGLLPVDSMVAMEGGTVKVSLPPREPTGLYSGGDRISLTAIPEDGYQFGTWGGNCLIDGNECVLTIDGNKDFSAGFVPLDGLFFGLDLVVGPDGSGEVQVQPPPNAPDGKYLAGTHLELRAIDSEGFGFTGWDGACVGDDQECRIVMNGDMSVTAGFEPDFYTLTINRVLINGAGVSIGDGQIAVYPFVYSPSRGFARSAIVSLTVDPDAGYVVVDWGGDCSGLEPNATGCTLRMDGDKLVEVTFAEEGADRKS